MERVEFELSFHRLERAKDNYLGFDNWINWILIAWKMVFRNKL